MRNSRDNHSNSTMLCKELAYPIRTVMHAFKPPDTPAKGGETSNSYMMESKDSERGSSPSFSNIPLHMEMNQGPTDVKATNKHASPPPDTQVLGGADM